jgi:uncharacterized DUF497 family protein
VIIEGFVWLSDVIDKLEHKHAVRKTEVEGVFADLPVFNRIERGKVKGEDLFRVLGKTDSGRYLAAFFIYKTTREALVISARDMTEKERRQYAKRKK